MSDEVLWEGEVMGWPLRMTAGCEEVCSPRSLYAEILYRRSGRPVSHHLVLEVAAHLARELATEQARVAEAWEMLAGKDRLIDDIQTVGTLLEGERDEARRERNMAEAKLAGLLAAVDEVLPIIDRDTAALRQLRYAADAARGEG